MGVKRGRSFLPGRLCSLAGIASFYISLDLLAHAGPVVVPGHQLQHLVVTWVPSRRVVMVSLDHLASQGFILGDVDPVLECDDLIAFSPARQVVSHTSTVSLFRPCRNTIKMLNGRKSAVQHFARVGSD